MAQMDTMYKLRKDNPDKSAHKIHFSKDKLLHNGIIIENTFEQNPLPQLNTILMAYDNLSHAEPISMQGSVFQGHAMVVHSVEDAVHAKDACAVQDASLVTVNHVMYACIGLMVMKVNI